MRSARTLVDVDGVRGRSRSDRGEQLVLGHVEGCGDAWRARQRSGITRPETTPDRAVGLIRARAATT